MHEKYSKVALINYYKYEIDKMLLRRTNAMGNIVYIGIIILLYNNFIVYVY